MGWSNVGRWDALHAVSNPDGDDNGYGGEVSAIDTRNCLVQGDGARVSLVGVSDSIVVASGNDILVIPGRRRGEMKKLIEAMKGSAAIQSRTKISDRGMMNSSDGSATSTSPNGVSIQLP